MNMWMAEAGDEQGVIRLPPYAQGPTTDSLAPHRTARTRTVSARLFSGALVVHRQGGHMFEQAEWPASQYSRYVSTILRPSMPDHQRFLATEIAVVGMNPGDPFSFPAGNSNRWICEATTSALMVSPSFRKRSCICCKRGRSSFPMAKRSQQGL